METLKAKRRSSHFVLVLIMHSLPEIISDSSINLALSTKSSIIEELTFTRISESSAAPDMNESLTVVPKYVEIYQTRTRIPKLSNHLQKAQGCRRKYLRVVVDSRFREKKGRWRTRRSSNAASICGGSKIVETQH